jgi:hypothetical protein
LTAELAVASVATSDEDLLMEKAVLAPLGAWESFYVIVGSSAAALTGLMFVVVALIAESQSPTSGREIAAFGTPTVVHFCAVLLIAAILSAPWPTFLGPMVGLGILGFAGVAYVMVVFVHARRQTGYKPVLEDWLWHVAFPFAGYAALLLSAIRLGRSAPVALFAVAGAAVLLLFIGIHNAWDTVTYLAVVHLRREEKTKE